VILGTTPLVERDQSRGHPRGLQVGLGPQKGTVRRQVKQSLGHGELGPAFAITTLDPGVGHPQQHQTRSADAPLGGRVVLDLGQHPEPEAVVEVDAHHRVVLRGRGVQRQRLGHEAHRAGEQVVPEGAVPAVEGPQEAPAAVQLGALLVEEASVLRTAPAQRDDYVEDEEVEFAGHPRSTHDGPRIRTHHAPKQARD